MKCVMLMWSCLAFAGDPHLDQLAKWMTGTFDSADQAEADESYYHIRLVMVPIWQERTDGFWLYVEQAAASALDKPYRQRVYHLTKLPDGRYQSAVYSFDDPASHIAAWKQETPLARLSPKDLKVREGCAVILKKQGDAYVGSTVDKECVSSLRGASYATSEITIHADEVLSWDRGFDADDQHVWGAEKAGYVFKRRSHGAPK